MFRRRREIKRAKNLLGQITERSAILLEAEQKIAKAQDEAENATRNAMFQNTTIWQLQLLIDQLRAENVRLAHEAERAPDSGVIDLNHDEASLVNTILGWYLEGLEEDEPFYNEQPRIFFLLDRLQISLSGG